ncbi:MAG TPA: pyridoxamine 5'-phosphate oxidase family protein [Ktedonobacteraceae bacterium]|jgi:nitroimidazol reductase NimA-like FMN-containing flavoprotein (pyridoxamine 5'-phosphate oxidase superfamily)|nr:pyridoxamine 5'-phosphate oxidase family protein [Ktedonobacteraceae bacterium]
MEETTLAQIHTFVAQYSTLVIATEHEGQPFATRIFFVEDPATETACTLYGTLITNSRKLANLKQNPHVGIFIGPDQPSTWMEATAYARVLNEERTVEIREKLAQKSPTAATFISMVATAAVELKINWLRITDLTSNTPYTEAIFAHTAEAEEKRI